MTYDYEEKKRKQISSMKSIMDYGMGVLFLLLGLFFLLHDFLNIDFSRFSKTPLIDILFGSICTVYGVWRIYRGYKKKYFK
jgi:small neutral amino acid transporter SnatA (MarC family)